MVGVPRSQGCRQCRRRKKGCDLNRPTCGQCERLGIACAFDEPRWTFVSQTMQMSEAGPSRSSRLSVSRQQDRSGSRSRSRSESDSPPSAPVPQHPRSMDLTAVESQANEIFWTHYLPKNEGRLQVDGITTVDWARTIQDLVARDDTAKLAFQCAAFTALGRSRQDEAMVQQGSQLYGRALVETNRAIQRPERAQSDAMLATIKLLGFYEAWRGTKESRVSSQGHDFQKHVAGTCRLVELRGPAKHTARDGHALFIDARANAIVTALIMRKPNFFLGRDWADVPWRGVARTLRDELWDVTMLVPDILHGFDRVKQRRDDPASTGEAARLLRRCVAAGNKYQAWGAKALQACHDTSRAAAARRGQRAIDPALETPTLREACTHFDYGFAQLVMTYWASCLLLYSATWVEMRDIAAHASSQQGAAAAAAAASRRGSGSGSDELAAASTAIPAFFNPQPLAANIAHCAHHFFSREAGLWGSQHVSFPMGVAFHYYAVTGNSYCAEMEQLKRVLATLRNGSATSSFLRSIAQVGAKDKLPESDCCDREDNRKLAAAWYGTRESPPQQQEQQQQEAQGGSRA